MFVAGPGGQCAPSNPRAAYDTAGRPVNIETMG
jgi:hypothetical protein